VKIKSFIVGQFDYALKNLQQVNRSPYSSLRSPVQFTNSIVQSNPLVIM